jgi:hypothetical protein
MQVEERVERRAYEIWERSGWLDGHHDAHWQAACREIEAEYNSPLSPEVIPNKSLKKAKARTSLK